MNVRNLYNGLDTVSLWVWVVRVLRVFPMLFPFTFAETVGMFEVGEPTRLSVNQAKICGL